MVDVDCTYDYWMAVTAEGTVIGSSNLGNLSKIKDVKEVSCGHHASLVLHHDGTATAINASDAVKDLDLGHSFFIAVK